MNLDWLNEVFEPLEFDIYDAKIKKDALGPLLTVEIEKKGYITFEDCQIASNKITEALEKKDPHSDLRIEVASAGAERALKTHQNYVNALGKTAFIKTETKSYNGIIESVQESNLDLKLKDTIITIPMNDIIEAHLTIVL